MHQQTIINDPDDPNYQLLMVAWQKDGNGYYLDALEQRWIVLEDNGKKKFISIGPDATTHFMSYQSVSVKNG